MKDGREKNGSFGDGNERDETCLPDEGLEDGAEEQYVCPPWLLMEKKIQKLLDDTPRKREDLTVSLGEFSPFGPGIRVFIDYGRDIAYKRVSERDKEDTYTMLTEDIPSLVGRIRAIVSSWEHKMINENVFDGLHYHVTFCKDGVKETYRGENRFPANYREFRNLLYSLT